MGCQQALCFMGGRLHCFLSHHLAPYHPKLWVVSKLCASWEEDCIVFITSSCAIISQVVDCQQALCFMGGRLHCFYHIISRHNIPSCGLSATLCFMGGRLHCFYHIVLRLNMPSCGLSASSVIHGRRMALR